MIVYIVACVYLFVFSTYHVVTGVVSVFFPEFSVKFYRVLYHFEPIETKQYFLMLKPWGALSIFAGITGFLVLFGLERFYPLLMPFVLLISIRVAYRLIFRKQIADYFQVDLRRNLTNIGMLVIDLMVFTFLFYVHHTSPGWLADG